MEAPGTVTAIGKFYTRRLGLMIGYGLEDDVQKAYTFLMNTYEPGDKVYLFGFSRGAYTVRALAALLYMFGLLRKHNEALVPYAFRMFKDIKSQIKDSSQNGFKLAAQFKATFSSRDCKPWFVGVWDTVSSVGWAYNPLSLPYTTNNPDIQIGRHAIAIDERRCMFRTNLWNPSKPWGGPKDLKQVWFPGAHGDVGGGYPEAESGLAKLALEWMIKEAVANGLLVDQSKVDTILGKTNTDYIKPNPNAEIHNTLTKLWMIAEYLPKRYYDGVTKTYKYRLSRGMARKIPAKSFIHKSAFERDKDYTQKLPTDAIPVE